MFYKVNFNFNINYYIISRIRITLNYHYYNLWKGLLFNNYNYLFLWIKIIDIYIYKNNMGFIIRKFINVNYMMHNIKQA